MFVNVSRVISKRGSMESYSTVSGTRKSAAYAMPSISSSLATHVVLGRNPAASHQELLSGVT